MNDEKGLKYDMRVLANNVEYFDLIRDHSPPDRSLPSTPPEESIDISYNDRGLRDSLWYFDGKNMQCWMDVEDLIEAASTSNERDIPQPVTIATDFYPTSVVLNKGILLGTDADLVQRRDVPFAFFRFSIRTQLFLPPIFHRQLANYDESAATSVAHTYQDLPYFSHALEILLHTVLDDEADNPPEPEHALLPSVLSFLASFPDYLNILVQCTRKTEVRSWRTLFAHLPPPQELFELSLEKGMLKTAGGYLLVLHTFDDDKEEEGETTSSEQCVRLLQKAKEVGDWDLCKELARFLMALDESGETLREAVKRMDLGFGAKEEKEESEGEGEEESVLLKTPVQRSVARMNLGSEKVNGGGSPGRSSGDSNFTSPMAAAEDEQGDYFSGRRA